MGQQGLSRRRLLAGIAVASVGGVAGCLGAPSSAESTTPEPTPTPRDIEVPPADDEARFAEVYEATIDSVAMVNAIGPLGPLGQGSGFVHSPGNLLTNEHVTRGATDIELQFPGNVWTTGQVVEEDPHSDLAIIAVDEPPASADPIEPSPYRPTVGQEVLAIGNPFGLEESVSQGIVSGVGRNLPTGEGFSIPDSIQTDASVNPGNSGGPLLTLRARYLGVITARQGQDIGLAVSWRLVERVAPVLAAGERYEHSFLGILSLQVTPAIARANGLDSVRGVIVVDLVDGGPSADHLQGSEQQTIDGQPVPVGGDIIVAIDGEPLETNEALSTFLALHTSPGDVVAVTVIRDGEEHVENIELGVRPEI